MVSYIFCKQAYNSHNLVMAPIVGDGSCFYRSVSHQMVGTQERYRYYRDIVLKYLKSKESEYLGTFFTKRKWLELLHDVRTNGWAGEVEILALAECLNVYIFVHTDKGKLFTYPEIDPSKKKRAIHVWYENENHYCSIKSVNGALKDFNPAFVPEYHAWNKLNSQDKNKLNLIHQLVKIDKFEDIMKILRTFNGSLVESLDYLRKYKSSLSNGSSQRKEVKRNIDSVSIEDNAPVLNAKIAKTKASTSVTSKKQQPAKQRSKSKSPPIQAQPTKTIPVPLEGYNNVYKVPLSKDEYTRLVAPRFKMVPLSAYLPEPIRKVRVP